MLRPDFGRPAAPADWERIREICCRAAEGGSGIPPERWPFFAEYWVGPYQRLLPDWTWVARDGDRVAGYLTGCPDTAAYAKRRWLLHRLPLWLRLRLGEFAGSPDADAFSRRFLGREPDREWALVEPFLPSFPAHLHVNVDEVCRGHGIGARLVELFIQELRKAGVAGLHLVCAEGAAGFYAKLGFLEAARLEPRPGTRFLLLVRRA